MSYVSVLYLTAFLPLTMLTYQITQKKYRWIVLLAASYLFFFLMSYWLIVFIMVSTLVAYKTARITSRRKMYTTLAIIFLLGLLVYLKYSSFIIASLGLGERITIYKIGLPLGISFYTLQAISYVIDVRRGRIAAEANLGHLALYLAFFPTIMEGPIVRYIDVSSSLFKCEKINYMGMTNGLKRILWGLFKKIVIADRLSAFVYNIFDVNPLQHNGTIVLVGAIAYTFQLYMDFSGVIDMSIGTAEIFNIHLNENFEQPFFSKSAAEFWKRWHISLGLWFKEYVFYPVLLSKPLKSLIKKSRKKNYNKHLVLVLSNAIALFAVWISNGLWHGSGWNFVFFGLYYFVILTLSILFEPLVQKVYKKLKINRESAILRVFQFFKVLTIVVIGELFFRADDLGVAFLMFKQILTSLSFSGFYDGSILKYGLNSLDFIIVAVGFWFVFCISLLKEKKIDVRSRISSFPLPLRWSMYYGLILIIVLFGAYGEGYGVVNILYAGF